MMAFSQQNNKPKRMKWYYPPLCSALTSLLTRSDLLIRTTRALRCLPWADSLPSFPCAHFVSSSFHRLSLLQPSFCTISVTPSGFSQAKIHRSTLHCLWSDKASGCQDAIDSHRPVDPPLYPPSHSCINSSDLPRLLGILSAY